MRKAVLIYNPHSGLATKKRKKQMAEFTKYSDLFHKYGYQVEVYKTKYHGHAKEIVKNLNEDIDLVISIGGDGTFNEAMSGNFERKNRILISHLPYGTTNDIGTMYGLGKNLYRNLDMILSGTVVNTDICMLNDHPFIYVAGFGKFMNIAYETSRKMKKKIGKLAYFILGANDFLHKKTPSYEITYEVNGEKYHGLYTFALISNATRIAGINNFYKNIKLNDSEFEVLFSNLKTKKDIVRSLIYLKTNDITKVPGFYFHRTSHLTITFHEKLKKPWCLDGEEYDTTAHCFDIRVVKNVKMLLPKKAIDKLFIIGGEEDELSTGDGEDYREGNGKK